MNNDCVADFARKVKSLLDEKCELSQICRMVVLAGLDKSEAVLEKTLEIENNGGMWLGDRNRKRTPGGVFFYLIKKEIDPNIVFDKRRRPRPLWEKRKIFFDKKDYGRIKTMNVEIIGMPGKAEKKGQYFEIPLRHKKGILAGGIPADLPTPPVDDIKCILLVSVKKWLPIAAEIYESYSETMGVRVSGALLPDHDNKRVFVFVKEIKTVEGAKP